MTGGGREERERTMRRPVRAGAGCLHRVASEIRLAMEAGIRLEPVGAAAASTPSYSFRRGKHTM